MDWKGRPSLYQAVSEALAQLVSGTVEENPQVLHLPSAAAFKYLELLSLALWTLTRNQKYRHQNSVAKPGLHYTPLILQLLSIQGLSAFGRRLKYFCSMMSAHDKPSQGSGNPSIH